MPPPWPPLRAATGASPPARCAAAGAAALRLSWAIARSRIAAVRGTGSRWACARSLPLPERPAPRPGASTRPDACGASPSATTCADVAQSVSWPVEPSRASGSRIPNAYCGVAAASLPTPHPSSLPPTRGGGGGGNEPAAHASTPPPTARSDGVRLANFSLRLATAEPSTGGGVATAVAAAAGAAAAGAGAPADAAPPDEASPPLAALVSTPASLPSRSRRPLSRACAFCLSRAAREGARRREAGESGAAGSGGGSGGGSGNGSDAASDGGSAAGAFGAGGGVGVLE